VIPNPGGYDVTRSIISALVSRVSEMVTRLERRPPLAEPEVIDDCEPVRRARRKYVSQITNNKFLQTIFSLSSSKDKLKASDSENESVKPRSIFGSHKTGSLKDAGRVIGLATEFDGDPLVIRQREFSKPRDLRRSKTEDSDSIFASIKYGFDKAQILSNQLINPKKKKKSQKAKTLNTGPKYKEPILLSDSDHSEHLQSIRKQMGVAVDNAKVEPSPLSSPKDNGGDLVRKNKEWKKSAAASEGEEEKVKTTSPANDQQRQKIIRRIKALSPNPDTLKSTAAEKPEKSPPLSLKFPISKSRSKQSADPEKPRSNAQLPSRVPQLIANFTSTTIDKPHKSSPEIRISPPTDAKETKESHRDHTAPIYPQFLGGLLVPGTPLPVDQYALRPLDGPLGDIEADQGSAGLEPSLVKRRRPPPSRMSGRPMLSRALTSIEGCSILPPLYESCEKSDDSKSREKETDDSGVASSEILQPTCTNSDGTRVRRQVKKYEGGSHTTRYLGLKTRDYFSCFSTYQGLKPTAADATQRRHLIGFLHRTSHLSLTSELSGDASFYLIGKQIESLGAELIYLWKLQNYSVDSGHRGRGRYEDSTMGSESDARMFSDEDDR